jgi:hypothetical protein
MQWLGRKSRISTLLAVALLAAGGIATSSPAQGGGSGIVPNYKVPLAGPGGGLAPPPLARP